jgi:hypothetical protein
MRARKAMPKPWASAVRRLPAAPGAVDQAADRDRHQCGRQRDRHSLQQRNLVVAQAEVSLDQFLHGAEHVARRRAAEHGQRNQRDRRVSAGAARRCLDKFHDLNSSGSR